MYVSHTRIMGMLQYEQWKKQQKKQKQKLISINIHIYQPLRLGRIWHKVNFLAEFNWFEFRVFLLLD